MAGSWTPTLGVLTNTYHTYSLDQALDGIAGSGFKGVEIAAVAGWTEHLTAGAGPAELDALRAGMARRGLSFVAMSGHSDITAPAGVAQFKRALDTAKALGIAIVNTGIGGHTGGDEDEAAFLRNIPDLADYAAERGLMIGLETHGSALSNGKQGAELIKRIGRDNVRINYDTANVIFYGDTRPEGDIANALPYLANVHLKDSRGGKGVWDFPPLGEGTTDFGAILRTLRDASFKGPISVEIEFQGGAWPPVAEVDQAVKVSYQHIQKLLAGLAG